MSRAPGLLARPWVGSGRLLQPTVPAALKLLLGSARYPIAQGLLLFAGFAALAVRLVRFTGDNSVDLLYADRWFYWDPLFSGADWARAFLWQYGSHRLGVGAWLTILTADVSGWNARAEALAVTGLVVANAVLGLALVRRLLGRLTVLDLVVPLLFLTLFQYEVLILIPSASLSALPNTFLLAGCFALLAGRPVVRYGGLAGATALATYTGYGFVMVPAAILVLGVELVRDRQDRRVKLLALATVLAAFGSFFVGYSPDDLRGSITCPPGTSRVNAAFWAQLWNASFQLTYRDWRGMALPLLVIAATATSAWRVARYPSDRRSLVLLLLLAFSLTFSILVTPGRSCLGADAALAPRYVPFFAPAFLAVYLVPQVISRWRVALLLSAAFLLLAAQWTVRNEAFLTAGRYPVSLRLEAWRACWVGGSEPSACDAATGLSLLPDQPTSPALDGRLQYIRDHRLGPFRGA